MIKILDVYLHREIIGELKQDRSGQLAFSYSSNWLNSPNAKAISYSLPLREKAFVQKECRAFFAGLLPEEDQRRLIAKNIGISADNDFSMLEKIGGECAGAISFISHGQRLPPTKQKYHWLSEHELADKLRELHSRPLLAGEKEIRLSLAGIQDKIAVCVESNRIAIPLNGAPSTHIIKLSNKMFEDVIFNEAFCLELGRKIGLPTVEAELKKVEDIHYLLIKRYDRVKSNDAVNEQKINRLHQEDFCQALCIVPANKYQNEGGPSLKECFNLLRSASTVPAIDLNRLMDIIIFNFFIGNCDAHGKNFSLLYKNNSVELSPFYDLISTILYKSLTTKMAMKLGGKYEINKITMENFEILAEEVGLTKSAVRQRIFSLAESITTILQKMDKLSAIEQELVELIQIRCARLLSTNAMKKK